MLGASCAGSKPGNDFVEDQEHPVAIADLPQAAQKAIRRGHEAHGDEIPDGRGARERDGVDLAIEQHPVHVVLAISIGAPRNRTIGNHIDNVCARLAQLVGQTVAGDVRARQEDALSLEASGCLQRVEKRVGAEFSRGEIDPNAIAVEPRRR